MYRSFGPSGRLRVLTVDDPVRTKIRTSDVFLAAASIGLLGGFCLLLLAGLTADAEWVASAPDIDPNS